MQVDSSQGIDAVARGLAKMLHSSVLVHSKNQSNDNRTFATDYDCGVLELFNCYELKGQDGYYLSFRISGSNRSLMLHSEKSNSSFTVEQLDDTEVANKFL